MRMFLLWLSKIEALTTIAAALDVLHQNANRYAHRQCCVSCTTVVEDSTHDNRVCTAPQSPQLPLICLCLRDAGHHR